MAPDPGTSYRTFTINYPSHNNEIPFAFLICDKNHIIHYNTYFIIGEAVICQNGGRNLNVSNVTSTSAKFSGQMPTSVNIENNITVAPLYFDTFNLIEFTIDNVIYYCERGMTFGDWVNSDYNIDNAFRLKSCPDGSYIIVKTTNENYRICLNNNNDVYSTDKILSYSYKIISKSTEPHKPIEPQK